MFYKPFSKLTHDNRIAYLWLKKADILRGRGRRSADSEGLIDHIRAIEPVVVAVIFEEMEPELTRVSWRSKRRQSECERGGGVVQGAGGHSAAARGRAFRAKPLATQRKVIDAVKRAINAAR